MPFKMINEIFKAHLLLTNKKSPSTHYTVSNLFLFMA